MKRRAILALAASCALAPLSAAAQSPGLKRVGMLLPAKLNEGLVVPYRKRLNELGWVEGRNLAIEVRNVENRYERLPALAAELVRLKVDVIVAASTQVTQAAKEATTTIPVVFAWVADPVGSGVVTSLARPGGNVTGFSNLVFEIAPKQLELLKTLVPKLERVAVLLDPKLQGTSYLAQLEKAAVRVGIALIPVEASSAAEIEHAFAGAARGRATAMIVPPHPLYGEQAKRIAQLAKQYRIPTAAQTRSFVAAGGLVSYGSDVKDGFLRTADYVDRILRGARPADLPVQQADRFELFVNRRTAAEFGLKIPQAVLLQATEVIE